MKPRHVPALCIFLLAGCSKIHEQRSFTLKPFGGNTLSISAPVSEQKVAVSVESDQPVNVWVLLEKDVPKGDKGELEPEKMKEGVLAKELATKVANLDVTVPGKEAFQIYVMNPGAKSAEVTVKVDSH